MTSQHHAESQGSSQQWRLTVLESRQRAPGSLQPDCLIYLFGSLQIVRLHPLSCLSSALVILFPKARGQAVTSIELELILQHLQVPMVSTCGDKPWSTLPSVQHHLPLPTSSLQKVNRITGPYLQYTLELLCSVTDMKLHVWLDLRQSRIVNARGRDGSEGKSAGYSGRTQAQFPATTFPVILFSGDLNPSLASEGIGMYMVHIHTGRQNTPTHK